jgi:putative YphP/YqiW family bacilliredoxin
MPYPEPFIAPMRAELADIGVRELRTPADVEEALGAPGTVMIVVRRRLGTD